MDKGSPGKVPRAERQDEDGDSSKMEHLASPAKRMKGGVSEGNTGS